MALYYLHFPSSSSPSSPNPPFPKQLSIDMGDEVRGHNKLLGTMVGLHPCTHVHTTHTHTHTPCTHTTHTHITHDNIFFLQNSEFDATGGLLSSSMKRVKAMSLAGHNRWMFLLILFILFVCFVLYYLIRWR